MSLKVIDTRHFDTVEAYGYVEDIYIPEDGEKVHLNIVGGNASYHPDVNVCISWGGAPVFVTHGDSQQNIDLDIIGDGAQELKIELHNDSTASETIGGYYKGVGRI